MKFLLLVLLLVGLCFVQVEAQSIALAGAKSLAGSATSLQITPFDTVASALRYMARTGPWYSRAQLDSAKATVPGGFTVVDTLRAYTNGTRLPPNSIITSGAWPSTTYIKQP